jgi:N,N'-diacetyllegionaminate synthase
MGKTFIIAEAGVNHNGSLGLALQLCDAAKLIHADAVKFQTFVTENLLAGAVSAADYQKSNTGISSQYELLKKLELSFDDFRKIKAHCDTIGIQFLSTPDDSDSLAFLVELGVSPLKVGSAEVNNIPYLREIAATGSDIILSTGMATLEEVSIACATLQSGGAKSLTVLHCTTNYPCAYENVNLKAMLTLKQEFGLPVGFSDHTKGYLSSVAAVALGAEVIEKHFTLDTEMDGPDHWASLNPADFGEMITAIRDAEILLGDGCKGPRASELEVMKLVRRRIVASKSIQEGDVFAPENVTTKRSNTGVDAGRWDSVIGQSAIRDFTTDEGIEQ